MLFPLTSLFYGVLTGLLIVLVVQLYAFHIRDHHPTRYVGLWRFVGDISKTRTRSLLFTIASIFWFGVFDALLRAFQPTSEQKPVLYITAVFLLVVFLAISFGISLYRLQQKLQSGSKCKPRRIVPRSSVSATWPAIAFRIRITRIKKPSLMTGVNPCCFRTTAVAQSTFGMWGACVDRL